MLNKVFLIGNIGKDPQVRTTQGGATVTTFSLATTEKYKKQSGELAEKTEWHNIVAWRQLAETCGKYLHKGMQVYVSGKIKTRGYEDSGGNKKYITEIVIDEMKMLGGKGSAREETQCGEPEEEIPF